VNPVTYRVRHINTDKELIAHVNRLRKIQPYIPPKEYSLGILSSDMSPTADLTIDPGVIPSIGDMPTPLASGDDGEPAYEMESVVGKKQTGDVVEYLVKFRGYPEAEWCLEENIDGQDLIDDYEKNHPGPSGKKISRSSRMHSMKKRLARRKAAEAIPENTATRKSPRVRAKNAPTMTSLQAVHGRY
jgi:hypothetical protein